VRTPKSHARSSSGYPRTFQLAGDFANTFLKNKYFNLVNEYKIGMFEQLKMESRLKGYRLASGSH
jgi:hypothetical protein